MCLTVVEFTVHCQTRLQSKFKGTVDSRYKGRKSLGFFISKCSGDIIISYMKEYAIFCTIIDFSKMFVMASPPESLVIIQNNLTELFIMVHSTKSSRMHGSTPLMKEAVRALDE